MSPLNPKLDLTLHIGLASFFGGKFWVRSLPLKPKIGILLKITDYSRLRNEKKVKGEKNPLRHLSFWVALTLILLHTVRESS